MLIGSSGKNQTKKILSGTPLILSAKKIIP